MDNLTQNLNLIKKHYHFCLLHGKKALVKKVYRDHFGKPLNFKKASTFNQKLHLRKLSRSPFLIQYVDKYATREYVASKIGKKYLVPLYFHKKHINVQDLESLPNSFAIKTTSGSGTNIIIKDKSKVDLDDICQTINSYTKIKYGYLWGEFFYNYIDNQIIAEKLLTKDEVFDYKIHCFRNNSGELRQIIEVLWGPKNNRHKNMYDINWEPLPYFFSIPPDGKSFKKPSELSKLLELSAKLSEGFNYVRVDLYIINHHIYFGELTFTPAAGFGKFNPSKYDQVWGDWIGDKLI